MLPSVGNFYRSSYIKDGEMKLCWITWMSSNCHNHCPYKRQSKGDQTDRHREKCGDKTDTETDVMRPQGREPGHPQKLQETKNRFSPRARQVSTALLTQSHQVHGNLLQLPQETNIGGILINATLEQSLLCEKQCKRMKHFFFSDVSFHFCHLSSQSLFNIIH